MERVGLEGGGGKSRIVGVVVMERVELVGLNRVGDGVERELGMGWKE